MARPPKASPKADAKASKAPKAQAAPADAAAPVALPEDLERWLLHLQVERRLAPRSLELYRDALQRLVALAGRDGVALRQAQPHHVRGWMAALHAGGLAPRSIALILSAWRGLYRWWGQNGEVALNPVAGLRAPKASKPLPKALSVEQAMALAEHESGEDDPALAARDHCIVELLYGCGLRVGELVGLDVGAGEGAVGWVDVADATVHVLGKGSKRRSGPVGSAALAALQRWLPQRALLAAPGERALFVSRRGTRLTPSQVRSRLRRQALQAGLPTSVHPHMLRHSYASHLLQSSGDLRAVQELLGHANISTTQVYTQVSREHIREAYEKAHPRAHA
jgi:integrase/recombinase XerC